MSKKPPKKNPASPLLWIGAAIAVLLGVVMLLKPAGTTPPPSAETTTIEGKFESFHADDFENMRAVFFYYVVTDDDQRTELIFPNEGPSQELQGARVRATGIKEGEKLYLKSPSSPDLIVLEPAKKLGSV